MTGRNVTFLFNTHNFPEKSTNDLYELTKFDNRTLLASKAGEVVHLWKAGKYCLMILARPEGDFPARHLYAAVSNISIK